MTAIAANNSSTGAALAALIAGSSTESAAAPAGTAATPSSSSASTKTGLGPATVVDLSDPAKAAVAKAQSDQAAAARLQSYVEAHSVHGNANGGSSTNKTAQNDPFQNILDETTATPVAPTIAPTNTALANIQAIAKAETPQPYVPFVPTKAVSNSVTFAGYTISISSNPSTLSSSYDLSGNGVSAYGRHFWPSDSFGSGTEPPPGITISGFLDPHNAAVEGFTITQNTATATGASVATSSGAAAATSAVSAQSSTITFTVNYETGEISVKQTAASVSAKASTTTAPGSLLSALA